MKNKHILPLCFSLYAFKDSYHYNSKYFSEVKHYYRFKSSCKLIMNYLHFLQKNLCYYVLEESKHINLPYFHCFCNPFSPAHGFKLKLYLN